MGMPDNTETYDMDLVASMGFGAFGAQPHTKTKKRRYNHDEAQGSDSARGSNTLPLGPPRKEVAQSQGDRNGGEEQQQPPLPLSLQDYTSTPEPPAMDYAASKTYRPIAESWKETSSRNGGKDELAYYSPSFVENPWRELERILKERLELENARVTNRDRS